MSREQRDRVLFDKISKKYMRKDLALSSALVRKSQLIKAMTPFLRTGNTLGTLVDIGCGVGAPAKYLSGSYDRYIGVDQSPEMIHLARKFNQDCSKAEFLAENIKDTVLAENTADVILSIGALHHMTEIDEVLENLVDIAKPGASFIVIEPQSANPLIQMMRWIRGWIDKSYSREQIFFSESGIRKLLSRHGITDLKISYQGYVSVPFAQLVIPPQFMSVALARIAIEIDNWFQSHLRGPFQKLSFNIIITGRFP